MPSPGRRTMVFFMCLAPFPGCRYAILRQRRGFGRDRGASPPHYLVRNSQNVPRTDSLGLVGQTGYAAMDLRELCVVRFKTQVPQAEAQGVAAGVFAHD